MKITCIGCNEPLTVVRSMTVGEDVTVRPCMNCGNELAQMLHAQRMFQATIADSLRPGLPRYAFIDPCEPPDDQTAMQYLTFNVTALMTELAELLQETGWKPWASSNHLRAEEALGEWVDAWHYMMNILWVIAGRGVLGDAGTLATLVTERYFEKREKNIKRQVEEDYDGVTGKCSTCHRDLAEAPCDENTCRVLPTVERGVLGQ